MAFGDEENGCNGSYAYAAECAGKGENVVAVLNADMVSYDEEGGERDDLSVACSADVWLYEYLVRTGALYGNGLIYDNYEWGASDHRRFWDFRYPALGVIEGSEGQGGVSRYPYVHTTEDTFDKVDPAFGVR
jgi:Zn-dependent M28 family amino/carboxypeptidase